MAREMIMLDDDKLRCARPRGAGQNLLIRRIAPLIVAGVAMLAATNPAWAQKTFYLDESTDFTGNGCENADLNDVTSSLRSRLNADGWSGQRFTNVNAWPQDYFDSTIAGLSGLDNVFGDNFLFTVYAGHGNRARIQFGFKRNNRCTVNLETEARLGRLGGNKAGYAMWVTSCTLNVDTLGRNFSHEVRQQFGYHNSPSVKDDQPRDFFEETDGTTNTNAWLDEMEDRPGWFTGDNSPVALSHGLDANHCATVRDIAKLRGGVLRSTAPEPWTRACGFFRDNGASGC
jgi:Family of unknown function (DUF6345)